MKGHVIGGKSFVSLLHGLGIAMEFDVDGNNTFTGGQERRNLGVEPLAK
jgi:hypothetical protein